VAIQGHQTNGIASLHRHPAPFSGTVATLIGTAQVNKRASDSFADRPTVRAGLKPTRAKPVYLPCPLVVGAGFKPARAVWIEFAFRLVVGAGL
jgi:hypothetical protein